MTLDKPPVRQATTRRDAAPSARWVAARPRIAVFAIDDLGLSTLKAILSEGTFPVIAASACLSELLTACARQAVDVVVFWSDEPSSVWQPDVQRLAGELPTAKVIVTAGADDGRGVRRALRSGASGFVPCPEADRCLVATIHAALAGQICVPSVARTQIARPALSHREKKILELLAQGLTNNEIGGRLFLAESTVKTHVSRCFRKLGVASRAEAAAAVLDPQTAVELGLTADASPHAGLSTNGNGNGRASTRQ